MNANGRKTGRKMLEEIGDAFLEVSFAYMKADSRSLATALQCLRNVYYDMKCRLDDNPDWRKWNDYFVSRPSDFNKDGETLFRFMERLINGTVHEAWQDKEWQRTTALIANRLQNIPYWIQEDARNAAEPFLSLLR